MAKGKNEILLSIALEGDQDVKSKLAAVGDAGKRSLSDVEKNVGAAGQRLEGLSKPLGEVREALDPLLEEAGLARLGGLLGGGLFAGLSGAAGPAALLAALTGIALRLAKVSEEGDKARGRLKALGDLGGFDKLTGEAKALGTDVSSLQPRYERFVALQQRLAAENSSVIHPPNFAPGQAEETAAGVRNFSGGEQISPPSRQSFQSFDSALLRQIRRDVGNGEEAARIAGEFESSLAQNRKLSPEALRSLQQSSPNAANFVTSSLSPLLGRGFANPNELATLLERGGARVGATDLINEGAKRAPEFDKEADAARGITEAFEALRASAGRLEEKFGEVAGKPINKALTDTLDKVTGGVDKAADLIEHNVGKIEKGAEIGHEIGSKTPIPFAGVGGAIVGGVAGGALGIGGDLLQEVDKAFLQEGAPAFLKNALINPAAIPGNEPAPPPGPSLLTPENLAATKIPSPLDGVSLEALLLGNPIAGAARILPDLFGLTGAQPGPAQSQPGAQQPVPVVPVQPSGAAAAPFAPDRTLDGLLIAPERPPAPAPGAEAQPAGQPSGQPPGLVQDVAGGLTGLLNQLRDSLVGPTSNRIETPTDTLGIRGEAAPQGAEGGAQNVAELNGAAADAVAGLKQLAAALSSFQTGNASAPAVQTVQAAAGGGEIRHLDDGGHLSGPGTSTSDSIPAMLSDGEYVIKASSARKIGRSRLDQLNASGYADGGAVARTLRNVRRFADGGDTSSNGVSRTLANAASLAGLGPGEYQITFDPQSGGAFIDGILHLPGDPLLDDPQVRQAIAQSKAGMNQKPAKNKYKSDFVGRFGHSDDADTYVAAGGPIGDWSRYASGGAVGSVPRLSESISRHFSTGGSVSLAPMLHLADGGGAGDVAGGGAPTLDPGALAGPAGSLGHFDVDLRTNHGDFKMMAPDDVARQMSRAAGDAALAQTGPRPRWFKGQ